MKTQITSTELAGIENRLAELNRRGRERMKRQAGMDAPLESLACERLAQGLDDPPKDETAPYRVSAVLEGEIKNLHEPFLHWLRLYQHSLQWVHSRPDKPSTIGVSTPDFIIFGCGGASCQIEFKARNEPEAWKPREEGQKIWAANARYLQIPYLCTNDLQEACQFVRKNIPGLP